MELKVFRLSRSVKLFRRNIDLYTKKVSYRCGVMAGVSLTNFSFTLHTSPTRFVRCLLHVNLRATRVLCKSFTIWNKLSSLYFHAFLHVFQIFYLFYLFQFTSQHSYIERRKNGINKIEQRKHSVLPQAYTYYSHVSQSRFISLDKIYPSLKGTQTIISNITDIIVM